MLVGERCSRRNGCIDGMRRELNKGYRRHQLEQHELSAGVVALRETAKSGYGSEIDPQKQLHRPFYRG